MKELLAPLKTSAQDITHLKIEVIKIGYFLKNHYPDILLDYIGGPITADGPENIARNLRILENKADFINKDEGAFTYTNPYVGDLRRFPGLDERDFMRYSAELLQSGIFDRLTLLEGWEKSVGSNDEYRIARSLGINIRTYFLNERVSLQD